MIDPNHSRNLSVRSCAGGFRILLLQAVLTAGLAVIQAGRVTAQTFRTLATNVQPFIVSGNTIYGFTEATGWTDTVVALSTDGTGLRTLYAFTPPTSNGSVMTNSDGIFSSGLTLSGSTLYGSCPQGGASGNGTLFSLNTDGTGFTVLYTFADRNSDGYRPSQLILSGGTLYGTTLGGASGSGTVFAIGTDGTGFTTLYSFSGLSDGVYPTERPLTLSGNTLYGLTSYGVFAVNTDGTGFATLHSFTALASTGCSFTNSDGASPSFDAGLILSSNTLYGTASYGGSFGNGTVFALNTDGTGFTVLHNFSSYVDCTNSLINADGGNPVYTLLLSGNTLYGTTYHGGSSGNGVVFAVNTDGSGFTVLLSKLFSAAVVSGNNLYGDHWNELAAADNLFSIALPIVQPRLSIVPAGANVVLSWPVNTSGLTCNPPRTWLRRLGPPILQPPLSSTDNIP